MDDELLPLDQEDLNAALRIFDALCRLRSTKYNGVQLRGRYDADDFDADELGLDPEEDFE